MLAKGQDLMEEEEGDGHDGNNDHDDHDDNDHGDQADDDDDEGDNVSQGGELQDAERKFAESYKVIFSSEIFEIRLQYLTKCD